jgi:hypothetical protein
MTAALNESTLADQDRRLPRPSDSLPAGFLTTAEGAFTAALLDALDVDFPGGRPRLWAAGWRDGTVSEEERVYRRSMRETLSAPQSLVFAFHDETCPPVVLASPATVHAADSAIAAGRLQLGEQDLAAFGRAGTLAADLLDVTQAREGVAGADDALAAQLQVEQDRLESELLELSGQLRTGVASRWQEYCARLTAHALQAAGDASQRAAQVTHAALEGRILPFAPAPPIDPVHGDKVRTSTFVADRLNHLMSVAALEGRGIEVTVDDDYEHARMSWFRRHGEGPVRLEVSTFDHSGHGHEVATVIGVHDEGLEQFTAELADVYDVPVDQSLVPSAALVGSLVGEHARVREVVDLCDSIALPVTELLEHAYRLEQLVVDQAVPAARAELAAAMDVVFAQARQALAQAVVTIEAEPSLALPVPGKLNPDQNWTERSAAAAAYRAAGVDDRAARDSRFAFEEVSEELAAEGDRARSALEQAVRTGSVFAAPSASDDLAARARLVVGSLAAIAGQAPALRVAQGSARHAAVDLRDELARTVAALQVPVADLESWARAVSGRAVVLPEVQRVENARRVLLRVTQSARGPVTH